MILDGITAIDTLQARMQYLQVRQSLIAQNVANADTPGFTSKDLKPFGDNFEAALASASRLSNTQAGHMVASRGALSEAELDRQHEGWALAPNGNSVVLEQEMIKAAETRAAYEMSSLVFSKHVAMTKAAFGARG